LRFLRRPAGGDSFELATPYPDPVRWLVDGMNVIGTRPDGWWEDRPAAMVRLVGLLERWAVATGEEVTVVFEQPPRPPISSTVIEVAHAPRPRRDSADDEIVRLLRADPHPGTVRVVTSDHWLSDRVHAVGATVQSSESFRMQLDEDWL
jgi:predicted RNA-binding protein with PIN domain